MKQEMDIQEQVRWGNITYTNWTSKHHITYQGDNNLVLAFFKFFGYFILGEPYGFQDGVGPLAYSTPRSYFTGLCNYFSIVD